VPGIDAVCIPNTFIINIGDQFARWTNDIFVSTRHRARPATTKDRYSIPFFFGCDHDVPLIPPPTCVSDERPVRYEVMTAGAYVHMRLSETYTVGKAEA
jgi:isopenicillin N synthase-like dioxygenase